MKRRAWSLVLFAATAAVASLTACGGGGGTGGGVVPTPTPSPTPTSGPATTPPTVTGWKSYMYLTSNPNQSQPQSRVRKTLSNQRSGATERVSRRRFAAEGATRYVPGVVVVTYDRNTLNANRGAVTQSIERSGGTLSTTFDYANIGTVVQILNVHPGSENAVINAMKSQPGVLSAGRSSYRHLESTTAAFTNDPYFNGFSGAGLPVYENTQPPFPGQWDMHAIFAANAWGYANPNTTGQTYAGAAGGTVPLAIIDTGADLTHPELQPLSRILIAKKYTGGNGQLTGSGISSMDDSDGHGTDVAGIAAATGNNGLGFAGVAYNAPLMIYKVFPDGGQNASGTDIGAAINDAVANGAKVISMSLGASGADPSEENAVANAIASGVVVVAAAGNGNSAGIGQAQLSYPAADPNVIAVGATSIDDTNPASAGLKVASYSNYQASKTNGPHGAFLVAPGGDPCPDTPGGSQCSDDDYLHWIENLYSSTAQGGNCSPDFDSNNNTPDCRILIAGTSQATPHVSGAVDLLLSVGAAPSNIGSLLCNSARQMPSSAINSSHQGCGQLNVYKAMATLVGDPNYP